MSSQIDGRASPASADLIPHTKAGMMRPFLTRDCRPLFLLPTPARHRSEGTGQRCVVRPFLVAVALWSLWASSAVLWHADRPPLLLNLIGSLPLDVYALTPSTTPAPGILMVFLLPGSVAALLVTRGSLAPHILVLQPVAALPGETVCVHADGVFIQGHFVAPVAPVDGLGRRLPRWRGCVTLGAGEVFPVSTWIPRSFDGRDFGPVPVASLLGRATPVGTWEGGAHGTHREWGQDKGEPADAPLPLENQRLRDRQGVYAPVGDASALLRKGFGMVANRQGAMSGEGEGYAHRP